MKKIIILLLCMLLLMTCIVGCNDNENIEETTTGKSTDNTTSIPAETTTGKSTGNTSTIPVETTTTDEITDEERGEGQIISIGGSEDAKRLGVDKVVVFVLDASAFPRKTEQLTQFNELLVNKYGCDFVVEFRGYASSMKKKYTHYEMVMDMKSSGHRADILYCGHTGDYSRFVEAGVYEPLNEYFKTTEGEKLYEAYSPEVWKKTERDGLIYGYMSDIYPAGNAYALCNTELAIKYGIEVPDGEWSFYDIGRYLEVAGVTQDNMAANEVLLSGWSDSLILMEGYTKGLPYQGDHIYFKSDGSDGWNAVDLSKEEAFLKLVRTVKEYSDKGWYMCTDDARGDQHYMDIRYGRFVFSFESTYSGGIWYNDNKRVITGDSFVQNVTCGKTAYQANFLMENLITGVTTWAEYKEEALKLITLINTEAELSNLLHYGIEGKHYVYENGVTDNLDRQGRMQNPVEACYIANMNLLHSVLIEPKDKVAYSKTESVNYPDGPDMLYDIDMSAYEEQLQMIDDIYEEHLYKLFRAQYEDVDAAVKEMGAALAAAGIDEVINELNRQMTK